MIDSWGENNVLRTYTPVISNMLARMVLVLVRIGGDRLPMNTMMMLMKLIKLMMMMSMLKLMLMMMSGRT